MTASTRYWTPLFLKADPPTTGTNLFAIVCRRIPAFPPQFLPIGVDGHDEARAAAIHFINEGNPRDVVFVRLTPDRFRLRRTPATASNTAIAPSSTRSERSTSAVKST